MSNEPQSSNTPTTGKFAVARVLDNSTGRFTEVPIELQGIPTTIDDDVVVVHAEAVPLVTERCNSNMVEVPDVIMNGSVVLEPPGGAPSGGEWGKLRYFGPVTQAICCVTCLVAGIPGIIIFCILDPACDEKRAYKATDDKIYDLDGRYVCHYVRSRGRFRAVRAEEMER